ncbi:MAG TPA: dephospho-CoA kinase [Cyclobacteriaceae bacterium]|nr:dephospho-CoA kinase [Cyclobacteriaceae bacterium]HRJ80754.1 dephospho-CoA kinase [Cyclobacteriaceae bacterium]
MKRPLQIGITGGIGSGKSLVCRIFSCLGVSVYDADSRAKSVMTTDGILVMQIKKEFGGLSYHADGSLNRNYLAETVFSNPDRLEALNKLVHPRVGEDYLKWLEKHKTENYILKEAALLYESGSFRMLDKVIVVHAPEAIRVARVKQRDPHRSEQDIKGIINNQMNEELKLKRADYRVVNDDTRLVIPQVLELHRIFSGGLNI